MTVKIIRFKEKHAPRVGEIFRSATAPLSKSMGGVYPDKLVEDWTRWSLDPANIIREFNEQQVKLFLAEVDKRLVGTFGYAPGSIRTRKEDIGDRINSARIRWMFVSREFQGLGIARTLHEEIMEEIRKEGYVHQYGYVIPSAHGFYEKMGWKHRPESDSFFENYPYDPVLQARTNELCPQIRNREIKKQLADFFFERTED